MWDFFLHLMYQLCIRFVFFCCCSSLSLWFGSSSSSSSWPFRHSGKVDASVDAGAQTVVCTLRRMSLLAYKECLCQCTECLVHTECSLRLLYAEQHIMRHSLCSVCTVQQIQANYTLALNKFRDWFVQTDTIRQLFGQHSTHNALMHVNQHMSI